MALYCGNIRQIEFSSGLSGFFLRTKDSYNVIQFMVTRLLLVKFVRDGNVYMVREVRLLVTHVTLWPSVGRPVIPIDP